MRNNIGMPDRIARFLIGVLVLAGAITQKSTGLALIGLFTLYEAVAGWCILYQLLGINTCSLNKRKSIFVIPTYATGVAVLVTAIALNMVADMVGLKTWYTFLQNPKETLSIDNYLFLFLAYPYLLGWVARLVQSIKTKA